MSFPRKQDRVNELAHCIQQLDVHTINNIIDCFQKLGQQERESPEEKANANEIAELILTHWG